MSDDLQNLENDVERQLAEWSRRLSVSLDSEKLSMLRTAVKREVNEQWLASQPMPLPSEAALAQVRSRVHAELRDTQRAGSTCTLQRSSWRRLISAQGMASLGAAAMLLICVGIVRYVGNRSMDAGVDTGTLASVFNATSTTDSIQSAVASLEESDQDEWSADDGDGSLEDLVQEMDDILEAHDTPARTSAQPTAERGVLG